MLALALKNNWVFQMSNEKIDPKKKRFDDTWEITGHSEATPIRVIGACAWSPDFGLVNIPQFTDGSMVFDRLEDLRRKSSPVRLSLRPNQQESVTMSAIQNSFSHLGMIYRFSDEDEGYTSGVGLHCYHI